MTSAIGQGAVVKNWSKLQRDSTKNCRVNLVQIVLEQTPRLVENFEYEAKNSEQSD